MKNCLKGSIVLKFCYLLKKWKIDTCSQHLPFFPFFLLGDKYAFFPFYHFLNKTEKMKKWCE